MQLCEVFDLVRRVGGSRCILRLLFRLLRLLCRLLGLLFFLPAAVMSDRGSRGGSDHEPAAPCPSSHSHEETIDEQAHDRLADESDDCVAGSV